MPSKTVVDTWSALIWLVCALYTYWESVRLGVGRRDDPGPGFFLYWSAVVLVLLSSIVLLRSLIIRREPDAATPANWRQVVPVLGVLALYLLFFERIGFLLTTMPMIAVLLRLAGVTRWTRIGAVAVGATLATYVVLHVWLRTRLPAGVLGWFDAINR